MMCVTSRFRFAAAMHVLAATFALAGAGQARAELIINPTFDTASFIAKGYDLDLVEKTFYEAAAMFERTFAGSVNGTPLTINITVSTVSQSDGGAGQAFLQSYPPTTPPVTYDQLRAALVAEETLHPTTALATAIAHLPSSDPLSLSGGYDLPGAEAKALGLYTPTNDTTPDGEVWIGKASAGNVEVYLHEISHAMGRVNGSPLFQLFRYTAPGQLDPSFHQPNAYFSIDGGNTSLAAFDIISDTADFASSTPPDPFDAYYDLSHPANSLTPLDITTMNVLGFALVPEPSSAVLAGIASVLGLAHAWRRRRARPPA